jgi:signal transduction histidine kinase
MKQLLLGVVLLLLLLSIVFYSNMMHIACIVSLLLALAVGAVFARYLNLQYIKNLERQEEIRKRLTSDVAHELRTPLTAVSANLEAIAEGALEPTPERIGKCYDEIRRLSKLVADMESLAKTESDILNPDKHPLDLFETARAVFDGTDGASVSGVSVMVNADRERVLQVLTNLKSNAEKYGGGSITVTVSDAGRYGEISVKDDGAGITPEDLPHIFERFYRADKSRNRAIDGAGIGLAIVKSIITAHGGTVSAESEIGSGSTFRVRLPKK